MNRSLIATLALVVMAATGCTSTPDSSGGGNVDPATLASAVAEAIQPACTDAHHFAAQVAVGHTGDMSALIKAYQESRGTAVEDDLKTMLNGFEQINQGGAPGNSADMVTAVGDLKGQCESINAWPAIAGQSQ